MISAVEFRLFRGFGRLRTELLPHAYIVGPNSAGKSTVLEAIALAEQCLQKARRQNPPLLVRDGGQLRKAFPLPAAEEEGEDPVRHEFGQDEARVTIHWTSGAQINMVWPTSVGNREPGFFYTELEDGFPLRTPAAVRERFTPVTVVPVVTPLDRIEDLKDEKYVRGRSWSRLASRHFRNHALHLQRADQWEAFKKFSTPWLPEIGLLDVKLDHRSARLGIFYSEPGSRVPKELAWAGDGMQIWVQLLWHLFRASDSRTIVLDEPEVYLHPDLQRRLVRLLDSFSAQIVMASHSSDVIAEAPLEGVLWIDRRLDRAQRPTSQRALAALSASLGSSYNLALARSARAQLVIATDYRHEKVIRQLARQVGALNLVNETLVSIVHLQHEEDWIATDQLGEFLREALTPRVPAVVLLQARFRPDILKDRLREQMRAPQIEVRFWGMPEVENYLLDHETIARASGSAPEVVRLRIAETCSILRDSTRAAICANWVKAAPESTTHKALQEAETLFDTLWSQADRRTRVVRGSEVLKELNLWLETEGYRVVDPYTLAKAIRPQALSEEVFEVLLAIDERLT